MRFAGSEGSSYGSSVMRGSLRAGSQRSGNTEPVDGIVRGDDGQTAAGGVRQLPTTSPTTTASGASRSPTTGGCSRSSASRDSSPGCRWLTILRKREAFRARVRRTSTSSGSPGSASATSTRLLGDAGIVRHRGKIESTINNAAPRLELVDEHGSLAAYVWSFEPAAPAAAAPPDRAACAR